MAKYTNKLQFIGILQFSQTHLRLEINFSKEIEKMITKNFHETLMCSFNCIFSIMIAFKPLCNHFLNAVMLFAIFCNHAIIVLSLRSPWFPSPGLQTVSYVFSVTYHTAIARTMITIRVIKAIPAFFQPQSAKTIKRRN